MKNSSNKLNDNYKSPSTRFQPADIIGVIVIVLGLGLIWSGINGVVGGLVTMVVAFYFGKKYKDE